MTTASVEAVVNGISPSELLSSLGTAPLPRRGTLEFGLHAHDAIALLESHTAIRAYECKQGSERGLLHVEHQQLAQ